MIRKGNKTKEEKIEVGRRWQVIRKGSRKKFKNTFFKGELFQRESGFFCSRIDKHI
jgi:hypothetical protein